MVLNNVITETRLVVLRIVLSIQAIHVRDLLVLHLLAQLLLSDAETLFYNLVRSAIMDFNQVVLLHATFFQALHVLEVMVLSLFVI